MRLLSNFQSPKLCKKTINRNEDADISINEGDGKEPNKSESLALRSHIRRSWVSSDALQDKRNLASDVDSNVFINVDKLENQKEGICLKTDMSSVAKIPDLQSCR